MVEWQTGSFSDYATNLEDRVPVGSHARRSKLPKFPRDDDENFKRHQQRETILGNTQWLVTDMALSEKAGTFLRTTGVDCLGESCKFVEKG